MALICYPLHTKPHLIHFVAWYWGISHMISWMIYNDGRNLGGKQSKRMYYMYQEHWAISSLRDMWQCNHITFENLIEWCTLKYILSQTYSDSSFQFIPLAWIQETSRHRLWPVIENMILPIHVLYKKYSMNIQWIENLP